MSAPLPRRAQVILALTDTDVPLDDALEWSTADERADALELLDLSRALAEDNARITELRIAYFLDGLGSTYNE